MFKYWTRTDTYAVVVGVGGGNAVGNVMDYAGVPSIGQSLFVALSSVALTYAYYALKS